MYRNRWASSRKVARVERVAEGAVPVVVLDLATGVVGLRRRAIPVAVDGPTMPLESEQA